VSAVRRDTAGERCADKVLAYTKASGRSFSAFHDRLFWPARELRMISTTFHGSSYNLTEAPCDPKPVQSPLPILVGTRSPRMLRITARYADQWNTWATPEQAAAPRAALLE
jgi:alkanesulfonate monooxygenase SsuD/methylene tetrahydromethanopterin reductase-like flavin-dependent oxidoreductase (luciferase family)